MNKEKNYQMTIEALNRKIDSLTMEKARTSDNFEEKLRRMTEEKEGFKVRLEKADESGGKTEENGVLKQKLEQANKKIEELDEMYKGQLAAFKRELISIKNQQQNHGAAAGVGESQEKLKEAQENIRKLIEFNEGLSKDNLAVKSQLEERNREVNELKTKLESYYTNERRTLAPKNFNSSKSSLVSSTPSRSGKGFFKLNFEEFEEKIQNLISENERLNNMINHSGNDSLMYTKTTSDLSNSRLIRENEDLKKNVHDLSNDNAVISKKLNDYDGKVSSMEKEFQDKLQKKEYDITRSYEKTLQDIEEQKEKNISKISKENFELKQQNDDLQRQLAKYPKSKNEELPKLPENKSGSSAILIINEMLTPSVKPNDKAQKEQVHSNLKTNMPMKQTLAQIPENQDENASFNNSEQKIKKSMNANIVSSTINLDPKKQAMSNGSNISVQSSFGGGNNNSSNVSTNYLSNPTTNNSSMYFNSGNDLKTEKSISSGGNNSYNNNMTNNNMNSSNIMSDGNSRQNFLKQGILGLNSKSSQPQSQTPTLNSNPSSLLLKNSNNSNLMSNSMANHNMSNSNNYNHSSINNNNNYNNINSNSNYSNISNNNNYNNINSSNSNYSNNNSSNANNSNVNINVYNSMNNDSLGKEKYLTKGYANVGLQKITPVKDLVGKEANNSFKGDNANGNKSDPKEKECSTPLSRCDSNKATEQKVSNFVGGSKSDVKKDSLIKDKKVIMFNLMENHRKSYNFQPGELYKQ